MHSPPLAAVHGSSIVFATMSQYAPATHTWFFEHIKVCIANNISFGSEQGVERVNVHIMSNIVKIIIIIIII